MYNPEFVITNDILSGISSIEAAKAVIENAPLLPLYERQFQSEATVRKVHYSTAIEGNYLDLGEVKKIINNSKSNVRSVDGYLKSVKEVTGEEIVARKRDVYEVINYRNVVKYIENLVNKQLNSESTKGFILTEKILHDIHKYLMKNILDTNSGKYRTRKAVSVNFLTEEKLDIYADYKRIKKLIIDLLDWYNSVLAKGIHPVLKAGIMHVELAKIHPYEEGNGRLARSVATLSLAMDGYDVNHFFCLDEYYDSNAKDYYLSLRKGYKNITAWLEYFTLGMAVEFNRVKKRILKISKDAKIKERVGQMFISSRQEKIIEWLNTYGSFKNQDFDKLFPGISDDTVLRELHGLLQSKIVVKKGKTKSSRYTLK